MYTNQTKLRVFLVCFLIGVLSGAIGFGIGALWQRDKDQRSWLENEQLQHQVQVAGNKSLSLSKTIDLLSDRITNLQQLIRDTKDKAPDNSIESVLRVNTELPAERTLVYYTDLPADHTFRLNNSIPIARFVHSPAEQNPYQFYTYDLRIRNTLLVGDKKSTVLTQVSSSNEPDLWYDVPSELTSITLKDKPYPRAHFSLGLGASTSLDPQAFPSGAIPQASLSIPWAYLHKNVRVLTPGVSIGRVPYLHTSLIDYNLGAPIPVLDDVWVSAGPSLSFQGDFGVMLGISTNL